jgi:hypothetical protein
MFWLFLVFVQQTGDASVHKRGEIASKHSSSGIFQKKIRTRRCVHAHRGYYDSNRAKVGKTTNGICRNYNRSLLMFNLDKQSNAFKRKTRQK